MLIQSVTTISAASGQALSADDPGRTVTLEQGKAEAAAMLSKGDAVKAYELYMRLVRLAPDDDAVNLGMARAAVKAKRWNQAVMAYETLLEKHPGTAALYGELANVYMLLGDRAAAERSHAMRRFLDGSGAKAETDKTLDALERRYSDLQFHGKIRGGFQYDSNANMGPASNDLTLGMWHVRVENAKNEDSVGGYLGANMDLGRRFHRDSRWWAVGDAQAFWRGHADGKLSDTHSRESQWGRAAVGLRRLSSSSLAEARAKVEAFDYEFYQSVSAFGPEGTLIWAPAASTHLILKAGLEKRDYSRDHMRNGLYGSVGAYDRVFFGKDNHELLVGARYIGAGADKNDYGYKGWEGTSRFLFKLNRSFELSPFVTYSQEFYKGPATVLENDKRRDNRLRVGLGLTRRINESWAFEIGYQYLYNDSNSELYTHKQHYMPVGVTWSF